MSDMVMSVEEAEHGVRISVSGDLDLPAGDALEALVAPMVSAGRRIEIEMSGIDFLDSSGLGAMLALSQLAGENGATMVVKQPSTAVMSALELTQTASMFTLAP
jgi:anti-sigma B factor antagonist